MESRDDTREADAGPANGTVDVHYYWTVIQKRKWIILAATALVTAAAIGMTMRKPKIYQASAQVIIDPQAPNVLGPRDQDIVELGNSSFWGDNSEYYNTQYLIIRSRQVAREVVRKYGLQRDPRLVPNPGAATEEELIDQAAGYVMGGIRVLPVKDSRVVGIAFRDRDPALAMELANHVATVYVEQNLEVKNDYTRGASKWVAKQLDEKRSELDKSETALYSYKQKENILSVALEDRQNMIVKSLEEFTTALTNARKLRIDLQARRKAVSYVLSNVDKDTVNLPSSYVLQAEGIAAARKVYLDEKARLEEVEKRYGPKHPENDYQRQRVESALTSLRAEARNLLKAIDAEIKALLDSETAYQAEAARLTTEALDLNEKEIAYKRLSRDAENGAAVYGALLKRYNESLLQSQDLANNIRPLDEARQPRSPVEPNMRNSAVLGFALGLILALGLAFFVEFLDRSVKSQEDIEVTIGLPFLGFVPSLDTEGPVPRGNKVEDYILKHPTSTVAECCRVVRTNILFCSPDRPLKSLVVTSSNPVEGKTMTVVNLGIVMAQSGHRTLIVDTDMRRPRLHKALGTSNENGISRLILGDPDINSAIKSTDVPNLFLLPCGPIPPNPAELLQTEKFAALAKQLAERFDRVIYDSPPVNAVTDAAVLSRVADGTVMVVRAGRTTRDAVTRAKRLMSAVNTNIIGIVLNDVNLKNPHYAGYYQYYQYKYHEAPAPAGVAKGTGKS